MTKYNPENCKNCSSKCAHHCIQLPYTTQHGAVLTIFPLNLQTSITAQMLSTGGEGTGQQLQPKLNVCGTCHVSFKLQESIALPYQLKIIQIHVHHTGLNMGARSNCKTVFKHHQSRSNYNQTWMYAAWMWPISHYFDLQNVKYYKNVTLH